MSAAVRREPLRVRACVCARARVLHASAYARRGTPGPAVRLKCCPTPARDTCRHVTHAPAHTHVQKTRRKEGEYGSHDHQDVAARYVCTCMCPTGYPCKCMRVIALLCTCNLCLRTSRHVIPRHRARPQCRSQPSACPPRPHHLRQRPRCAEPVPPTRARASIWKSNCQTRGAAAATCSDRDAAESSRPTLDTQAQRMGPDKSVSQDTGSDHAHR